MSKESPDNPYYLAVVNTANLGPNADPGELANFKAAADPFIARVMHNNDALKAFVDPRESDLGDGMFSGNETMVNLTVWESPQALATFLEGAHRPVQNRYQELFAPMGEAAVALWWTSAEDVPDYAEAEDRLLSLRENGPTEYAFDYSTVDDFPAPE